MEKRLILPSLLILLCGGMSYGQSTAYTYVQKFTDALKCQGDVVSADGAAAYSLGSGIITMEFDADGNAIQRVGDNIVARLTAAELSRKGGLTTEFTNGSGLTAGSLTATVTDAQYATLYSPFQLTVSSNPNSVEIYAPSYDTSKHLIMCKDTTKVGVSDAIPPCTGLVLHTQGDITFTMSAASDTYDASNDDLSGTALALAVSNPASPADDDDIVYTLGYEKTSNAVGFFKYNGNSIAAGKAYLVAPAFTAQSGAKKYVGFSFDDDVTGMSSVDADLNTKAAVRNGKYIVNGRVMIVKDGRKYNLNGQEVK